jgi:D-alanyl-D-alanine carboxypeptidase
VAQGVRGGVRLPGSADRVRGKAVLLALVLASLAAACAAPTASPETLMPPPPQEALVEGRARRLAGLLQEWVAAGNGTGVTAAVVSADGSWSGAAGVDGAGRPLVRESAMAVASITKTFTAAEVLHLADLGLLELDAPVSDYVDLPFNPKGATVRQLLNMRSGFPADPWDEFDQLVAADVSRSLSDQEVLGLVAGMRARGGQRDGAQEYSNLNYVVLGMVIEQVTGTTLAEAFRRDLIEPADLARAWVQDEEVPTPPVAVGEERAGRRFVDADGPYLPSRAIASAAGGAGSMASDAPSVARWGYLLYGGHVISSELVEQMTQSGDDRYGLGTSVGRIDGDRVVGHQGSLPGYHGVLYVWPEKESAVAVISPNTANTHPGSGVDASDLAVELSRAVES